MMQQQHYNAILKGLADAWSVGTPRSGARYSILCSVLFMAEIFSNRRA